MRRSSFLTFLKEKSFLIVLTLMLVSAGTMAALFAFDSGEQTEEQNQVAEQAEILKETPMTENTEANLEEKSSAVIPKSVISKKTTDTQAKTEENIITEAELEDQFMEAEETAEVSTADVIAEGFSESTLLSLQWPVEGEVILPFSMDRSVYFKTLAQYQYNPAMIISASEGTEIFAAAAGTVIDVGKSNEYGHYVTVDLGDGFMLTYGQLFDISTEVGENLETGDRIAMVAYPTRSYLEEGEHLYFKLTQNDVPVDPELYLEK